MKLSIACFFVTIAVAVISFAGEVSPKNKFFLESALKKDDLGIWVGNEDFSLNPNKKFTPASLVKILTTGAFLKHYPENRRVMTKVLSKAEVVEGRLKGDLYLVGGGNPVFHQSDMLALVDSFIASGVRVVEGDLYIDDFLFKKEWYGPDRKNNLFGNGFDGPAGAMSFSWNSINLKINPGSKVGDAAQVLADFQNSYVNIVNKIKTSSGETKLEISSELGSDGLRETFVVSGQISRGSGEKKLSKEVADPSFWSLAQFAALAQSRGVVFNGKFKRGRAPMESRQLGVTRGVRIQEAVLLMNHFSNNYISEMLCKLMSTIDGRSEVALEDGVILINKYLEGLGLNKADFEVYDSSGLSRKNKVTARVLFAAMDQLANSLSVGPVFVNSLALNGREGTLETRFRSASSDLVVRGKTGTLRGVVSLAGFIERKAKPPLPFVFIYNGPEENSKVIEVFDSWVLKLSRLNE